MEKFSDGEVVGGEEEEEENKTERMGREKIVTSAPKSLSVSGPCSRHLSNETFGCF